METKMKGTRLDPIMLPSGGGDYSNILAAVKNLRIRFICNFWERLIVIYWDL